MSIAEFIRESVLRPRLKQAGALVVYDADKRYREQCFDLAADKVRVVDATESSIESREAALAALRDVGHLYFHGGASLAEAVVPVLVARLDTATQAERVAVKVELNYKGGAKRITTRLPVVDVMLICEDMFMQDSSVEILLEAQDAKGNVVGEPRPGGDVNPATRTITLMPGQRKQIALRMDEEFRGKFSVKALNPTTLVAFNSVALETDYTE